MPGKVPSDASITKVDYPGIGYYAHLHKAATGSVGWDPATGMAKVARLLAEAICLNELSATLTRAGSAYNPVDGTTAANNVRRRWPFAPIPGGKTFSGDFVEDGQTDAATNLFLYSDDITNAAWTKNDVTVTANQMISYDGVSLTMPKVEVSNAASPYLEQSWTLPRSDGTRVNFGVYIPVARPGDVPALLFEITTDAGANGFRAWYNPATGAFGTTGVLGTGLFDYATVVRERGHYRLLLRGRCGTASAAARLRVYLVDGDNSTTAAAVGKFAYLHGFQTTARAVNTAGNRGTLSSHVVTTSAAITRANDLLWITAFPPNADASRVEGTMLVFYRPAYWGGVLSGGGSWQGPASASTVIYRSGASNGANGGILALQISDNNLQAQRSHGGGATNNLASAPMSGAFVGLPLMLLGHTWKYNSNACWLNGAKLAEDVATADYFDALTDSGNLYLGGCGYQVTFYIPRALSAAEMLLLARAGGFA